MADHAAVLLARLEATYDEQLPAHLREVWAVTLASFPRPVANLAVDFLIAQFSSLPELDDLRARLEHEADLWAPRSEVTEVVVVADASKVRDALATARAALGGSA